MGEKARFEENLRRNRWLVVESCGGVAMGKDGWEVKFLGGERRAEGTEGGSFTDKILMKQDERTNWNEDCMENCGGIESTMRRDEKKKRGRDRSLGV